jgi:hypothetical protein
VHSLLQLQRQRVYRFQQAMRIAMSADHLRVDPALRLALGKELDSGARQPPPCCFESKILAIAAGLGASRNVEAPGGRLPLFNYPNIAKSSIL